MKELFADGLAAFENQTVTGYFVAVNRSVRTKADGAVYLSMTLCDATGQLEARMWEMKDAGDFQSGDVVKVRGQVCRYQEKLQLKVDRLRRADPEADPGAYELGDFVVKTKHDVDELWQRLCAYVQSLEDPHLRALLESFLGDAEIAAAWREAPAAKALHHAWIGGLLEHVVSLLELCERVVPQYPEVHRDLLLAGAMLHDIGKLHELRWGTSFRYSTEGQLLGHISIGAQMIDAKIAAIPDFPARLRTLLLHIVLSHHGRLEFGSPKLPMIAEALLFHYLDDLEAKMQTVRSELKRAADGGLAPGETTEWVRALERPLLDTHTYLAGNEPAR